MHSAQIALKDVDEQIAAQLLPHLTDLPGTTRRLSPAAARLMYGCFVGSVPAGGAVAMLTPQTPLVGAIVAVGMFVSGVVVALLDPIRPEEVSFSAAELRTVLPKLQLTEAEQAYVQALSPLAACLPTIGADLGRELLAQLNRLLQSSRELEREHKRLLAFGGPDPLTVMEREHTELLQRLKNATDVSAREALEQSLSLCSERLRNTQILAAALSRVDAQQEVVYQSILAVHSSLTRLQAAPADLTPLEVEDIRETTTALQVRTRSLESAVEEVAALRVS